MAARKRSDRERFIADGLADGYTEEHMQKLARTVYPTPREAALAKAHQARRENAAARRAESQKILAQEEGTL